MASKAQEAVIGDGSLHIGDRVVYPNQGICRITGVAMKHISGYDVEMVTLSREEDGATVMVPKAKVMGIGLRRVADIAAIDKVFDDLSASGNDAQLDWKVRHRENAERMSGGGLTGTVEVLKGLHALSRIRPLPQKERELYDSARHLLVSETAAAMNIPLHVAEDNLDYALWPPVGMKRKGRELEPATLGPPPATPVKTADDDDLGFEDEEAEATPATPAAKGETDDDEEDEGDEDAPKARPAAGKKAAAKPAAAAKAAAKSAPASLPAMPVKPALAPPRPALAPAPSASASHAKPAPAPAASHAKPALAPAGAASHAKPALAPAGAASHAKPALAPAGARPALAAAAKPAPTAAAKPVGAAQKAVAATPKAPAATPAKHPAPAPAKPAPAARPAAGKPAPAKAPPAKTAAKPDAAKSKPAPAAAKKAPAAKKAAAAPASKTKPKGKK